MRTTASVLLVLAIVATAAADQYPTIRLWPNGLPADAKPVDPDRIAELQAKQTAERITYVDDPSLTVLQAPVDKANGCGVVVFPGGGYNILAWPKEGLELGKWFNSIGVTAAVLKYRVPRRDPEKPHWEPFQDAQRAIRLMRKNADKWQVDPTRVGVMGFSAGGHLAFMTGTHFNDKTYERVDDADDLSARPDFLCPIYAAYLGEGYRDDRAQLGSLVKITSETPQTFMAVTMDDKFRGVQAAMMLAEFKKAKVPAEAHIYASGGHGYGIRPSDNPVSTWNHRLHDWMRARGLLSKRRAE